MSVQRHGNKFRIRLPRKRGEKQTFRTFDNERDAIAFDRYGNKRRDERRTVDAIDVAFVTDSLGSKRVTDGSPTVAEFGRIYAEDQSKAQATRDVYTKALRKMEAAPLGALRLGLVEPTDCQVFASSLGTKENRRATLAFAKLIFRRATRQGYCQHGDPWDLADIKLPAVRQKDIVPLTVDEVEKLVRHASNEREALCFRIGAYAGLRGGEVGALHVSDVDFIGCHMRVGGSTKTTSAGRELSETKTGKQRTIQVACSLVEEIRDFVDANTVAEDGLIFKTERGALVTQAQLSPWSQRAAKRAALRQPKPGVPFHDLRHTCASLLIAAGAPIKAVSQYLGHADVGITMRMYAHLYGGEDAAIANAMEGLREAYRAKALPTNAV